MNAVSQPQDNMSTLPNTVLPYKFVLAHFVKVCVKGERLDISQTRFAHKFHNSVKMATTTQNEMNTDYTSGSDF